MTLIPKQQEKNCLIACSEDKVKQGHCDCVNRMRNQALNIPDVVKPLPQDTDGCSNDRGKCSCKHWGGCPVD